MKPIIIVQGGQWGSESKGAIAARLCVTEQVDLAVRTGGTNAGHTVWFGGHEFKMQQLPVGFVNPTTTLVLGAAALIDPVILAREIAELEAHNVKVRHRLVVDPNASYHFSEHQSASKKSDRHHLIGATGKGCSEALVAKIKERGKSSGLLVRQNPSLVGDVVLRDTAELLNLSIDGGARVLLEGTQGTLLDLHTGPWPYTTHKSTLPAAWMAEAGLSPALPVDIVMVVRTYPIRVAGNSGPMPDEISWPMLARRINATGVTPTRVAEWALQAWEAAIRDSAQADLDMALPPDSDGTNQHEWTEEQRELYKVTLSELHARAWERISERTRTELKRLFETTTVTKKLRRIADLNYGALSRAARLVRPTQVAVTFLNYVFPATWNTGIYVNKAEAAWLQTYVANPCKAPVTMVNRGPLQEHIVETYVAPADPHRR